MNKILPPLVKPALGPTSPKPMKAIVLLAILVVICAPLCAANRSGTSGETDASAIAAATAADAERLAATMAGDHARLNAVLSDELRYAHSSGLVDSKTSFIAALSNGKIVYESFEYLKRDFLPAAPGVVLMTGRVLIHVVIDNKKIAVDLNFLSVWRQEKGHWRFLAWQSCTNPPATAAKK